MTTKTPLILVTNDDGILAPGLAALVDVVRHLGDIIVVAPDSPQSGKGHAITIDVPLRLNQVDAFGEIEAYECSGTPVDCVKLAMNVIKKDRDFDLCVSGINHGSNEAINIIYSGTMSAAMEASLEGVHSVGFSLLDYSFDANFEPAKPFIKSICHYMLENNTRKTRLLNVNIPTGSIKGMRICRQGEARWVEEFREAKDPRGKDYYWLTGKFEINDDDPRADVNALRSSFISIVPSKHDLTDYTDIDALKPLEKQNGIYKV